MYHGKLVFAQIMEHWPVHEFQKCVTRYGRNYKTRGFSCHDQFLCMSFAQLTFRESSASLNSAFSRCRANSIIWGSAATSPARLWPTRTRRATGVFTPILLSADRHRAPDVCDRTTGH